MNISAIAIRNHVFAWMLMAAMLIFGGIAFTRMGVSQMPNVDFPVVNVSVALPGAAPEVMETDVIDPIEGALTSVQGIKSMSSTARTGSANVSVEFDLSKDINVAVQEIQSAVSRVQKRLPTDVEPPSVSKTNSDAQPIMWLSVTADKLSSNELMTLVRDQVQDRFTTIEGVGEISLGGYREPNLRVWLDPKKLAKYQLTASDVVSAIQREHSELPAGRIETSAKEFNIRTMGEARTIEDFGNITISRRGGALNYIPIALKDVATVERGTEDVRALSFSGGKVAVGLGIQKQPGANAVEVGREVKKRMAQIAQLLPPGVQIGVRFDSTKFIEDAVNELNWTLLFSAILTALVCWLFLGSLSATLNVVLAIPTSVVGSFIVLYALGFTLNTFTLLGLSLAIGIVVDDAIMVLENIVRHKEMGKSKLNAALDGSSEITLAALAATAAIIAIFLPVAFMQGIIGKYFLQFGVTLSVAVALSLVEALTLTPMRTSRFLNVEKRTTWLGRNVEAAFVKSADTYKRMIPHTLNHPFLTVGASILFFVGTLLIGRTLKQEFVPAQDQGRLMLRLQAPVGSSLEYTRGQLQQVEDYLANRPEVDGTFSAVGGFGGGGQVNGGMVFLTLKEKRKVTAQELMVIYKKEIKLKGARLTIQDPSLSGFSAKRGYPIEFSIHGPDWGQLVTSTNQMMEEMEKGGLVTDVDTNYKSGMPEVQIIPDRTKARMRGVEISDISTSVNAMMAGTVAGRYSEGGKRFDIRVALPADARRSNDAINTLLVRNNRGELIPLADVVTLRNDESLQSISREDRSRAINSFGNVAPGASQAKAIENVQAIAKRILPPGYNAVVSGSAQTFQESSGGLILALLLGIVVSYMVLASQFNSFIHPITILIALPFSISGAFIALKLGGQTLNVYSMIGLILLMGIVKKNSILLVEFTNQMRERGLGPREALIEACPVRLRPILMTSIATVVGAIPPALAIGPGAESRIPMALGVIGGVTVSTVLTLFVVPCVYELFEILKTKFGVKTEFIHTGKADHAEA
jgi:hydrophobe/amphiphile efflux-1 (HAE1) family protein